MNKLVLLFLTLFSAWFCFGCSKENSTNANEIKPIYVELVHAAFQGKWVKDIANCSESFGENQVNILENQLVFKTKIARTTKIQLAGRALYINANVETENGAKSENYELIISKNGKMLVASDGLERFKCIDD